MTEACPQFRHSWNRDVVTWRGPMRPTPLSTEYVVRITYKLGSAPSVDVLDPKLMPRAPGEKIPHTYTENRLCLYLPRANDWTARDLIADTIVPWTSFWLFFYETWHATGEWLGGGEHPKAS